MSQPNEELQRLIDLARADKLGAQSQDDLVAYLESHSGGKLQASVEQVRFLVASVSYLGIYNTGVLSTIRSAAGDRIYDEVSDANLGPLVERLDREAGYSGREPIRNELLLLLCGYQTTSERRQTIDSAAQKFLANEFPGLDTHLSNQSIAATLSKADALAAAYGSMPPVIRKRLFAIGHRYLIQSVAWKDPKLADLMQHDADQLPSLSPSSIKADQLFIAGFVSAGTKLMQAGYSIANILGVDRNNGRFDDSVRKAFSLAAIDLMDSLDKGPQTGRIAQLMGLWDWNYVDQGGIRGFNYAGRTFFKLGAAELTQALREINDSPSVSNDTVVTVYGHLSWRKEHEPQTITAIDRTDLSNFLSRAAKIDTHLSQL